MGATFAVNGIIIALIAIAMWPLWPGTKAGKVGLLLIGVGGVAETIAGLSPVNLRPIPHEISAVIAISCLNIGVILLGLSARRKRRLLGRFTLLCGCVGMIGFLMDAPICWPWIRWMGTRGRFHIRNIDSLRGELLVIQ